VRTALTIAGSDSGGGAGIQADIKTFAAHGVYGMSVITAVTAQNTCGVYAVLDIPVGCILAQLDAVFSDIPVHTVKIGMLSRPETIIALAEALPKYRPVNVVLDPVMVSKSGFHLLQDEAKATLRERLLPLADLVTPNLPEAEELLQRKVASVADMMHAAERLVSLGAKAALVKGGHLPGEAVDVFYDGRQFSRFASARLNNKNTHGTGCTLSSAIAANLALGHSLTRAIELSKEYIFGAIAHAFPLGRGVGPTHHFFDLYRKAGLLPTKEQEE